MASSPPKPPTQSELEKILPDLLELAKVSFNTVLDADKHEDEKAYRILTAIAFLTAAAAVIFAAIYQTQSSSMLKASIYEIHFAIIAFSLYIFFILIGSTLYLLALGPNLNIPAKSNSASGTSIPPSSEITSLLFFEAIKKYEKEKWYEEWRIDFEKDGEKFTFKGIKNTRNMIRGTGFLEDLREKMYCNYVVEVKLIAEKASVKVILMKWGNIFFLLAFMSLIGLTSTLFPTNSLPISILLSVIGIFFLLLIIAAGYRKLPGISVNMRLTLFRVPLIILIIAPILLLVISHCFNDNIWLVIISVILIFLAILVLLWISAFFYEWEIVKHLGNNTIITKLKEIYAIYPNLRR